MNPVELEGRGLFGGGRCRVMLSRTNHDHVRLSAGGGPYVPIQELRVLDTRRTTTVGHGSLRLVTVEHLFAALAGSGVYANLDVAVSGSELPLLDGGAGAYCTALAALGLGAENVSYDAPRGPRLRVDLAPAADAAEIAIGESVYRFSAASDVHLAVTLDFDDARIAPQAEWAGGTRDFVQRIAPARTFVREAEAEAMIAAGFAVSVEPSSVVVLASDTIHAAGRVFEADEPARHKLLDLMGDLYLHGGPPLGRVHAHRPGHAATHAALAAALERGILRPR